MRNFSSYRLLGIASLWAATGWGAQLQFEAVELAKDLGVVYAVTTADVNNDGKLDVLALTPTEVLWFENPTWKKHLALEAGKTKKDNVCFAPYDIDGDGKLDFAVGADWQPANTASGGSLQWFKIGGPVVTMPEEPTLHRIRWADVDGDGRKELIVAPLHGRGNKGPAWEGAGSRLLVYRIPKDPVNEKWQVEVAEDSFHILHNFTVANFDNDPAEEILTASREGVHLLKRGADGKWKRMPLGMGGNPGEIKLGHIGGRRRAIATVEPWHGTALAIYEEPWPEPDPNGPARPKLYPQFDGKLWPRQVIEDKITGGHAIGFGDFDGDGADELAAGWRDGAFGVAVYGRGGDGKWSRTMMVDSGGMAAEDLVVADLDGDGLAEIVAGGRKTQNVKIYWNKTKPEWKRHVMATGYANQTAVAADFTGDGKVDIIVNHPKNKQTILYVAPDWKPVVLYTGAEAIHSAVMDVDGDGDLDYVGARYTPGLIFWLERPKNPLKEKWTYRVVDEVTAKGVNGIHGLLVGDVDGDKKPDLIGNSAQPDGTFPNSLAWFRVPKNVKAAKQWERHIFADKDAPGLSHYFGLGDVNGDGRADIAAGAKIGSDGNWFAWWEQPADRNKAWVKHVISAKQPGATNIQMADVNGDGKMDFIATRGHGKGVVWFEAPLWTAHEIDTEIVGPHSLAIGDIDGDGDVDAATCAKDSFTVAWYENDGRGSFKVHYIWRDQAAYDIRLADMDGDGDLDMLIAGQASENVVWMENRRK